MLKVKGARVLYGRQRGYALAYSRKRFMEDPFKWPSVWKWNPYVRNPHLIYPGDVIKVTRDGMELVQRPPVEPVPEPHSTVVKLDTEGSIVVS